MARIFELYASGKPARAIADIFSREGVPTPNEYHYKMIGKPNPFNKTKTDKWSAGSIAGIIKNPAYYGAIANGKRYVKSFKNKNVGNYSVVVGEAREKGLLSKASLID